MPKNEGTCDREPKPRDIDTSMDEMEIIVI